jgi:hypothetical protein
MKKNTASEYTTGRALHRDHEIVARPLRSILAGSDFIGCRLAAIAATLCRRFLHRRNGKVISDRVRPISNGVQW